MRRDRQGDCSSWEVRGRIVSKEEEREDNGVEEASWVDMRKN